MRFLHCEAGQFKVVFKSFRTCNRSLLTYFDYLLLLLSIGTADSLYDEVGPGTTEQQQSPNLELSVPDYNTDETKRLSNVSNDYELVEVKHTITTVDDSYSGLVDEGPRPKTDSCGRGGSEVLVARRTPAGSPSDASGPDGAQGDQDDNDEPHYELVAPRKASQKETVHSSSFGWV